MAELTLSVLGIMTALYCATIYAIYRWRMHRRTVPYFASRTDQCSASQGDQCCGEGYDGSCCYLFQPDCTDSARGSDIAPHPPLHPPPPVHSHPPVYPYPPTSSMRLQKAKCQHCTKCGGLRPRLIKTAADGVCLLYPPRKLSPNYPYMMEG